MKARKFLTVDQISNVFIGSFINSTISAIINGMNMEIDNIASETFS